jgi:hypothetical protein
MRDRIAGLPFKDCNLGPLHVYTPCLHCVYLSTVLDSLARGLYDQQVMGTTTYHKDSLPFQASALFGASLTSPFLAILLGPFNTDCCTNIGLLNTNCCLNIDDQVIEQHTSRQIRSYLRLETRHLRHLFSMNTQARIAATTAMQETATQIAQKKCSTKINSILQQLKSAGLQHITDVFIQEWCLPLPPIPRDAALDLVQRLALLYTLLENWKVSIAITYNPLMTAMGYTYQGHDFGWKAQDPINNTWSSMPSTPL